MSLPATEQDHAPACLKDILDNLKSSADERAALARLHRELIKLLGAEEALFFLAKLSRPGLRVKPLLESFTGLGAEFSFAEAHPLTRKARHAEGFHSLQLNWQSLREATSNNTGVSEPVWLLLLRYGGKLQGLFVARGVKLQPVTPDVKQVFVDLANEAGALIFRRRQWRRMRQAALESAALLQISRKISASLDLNRVLQTIIDSLRQVLPCDHATIFLIDHRTGAIQHEVFRGIDERLLDKLHLKIGKGISGWVAKSGKSVIIPDVRRDPRYVEASPSTRSELAVPLKAANKVIGVFNLEKDELNAFTRRDVRLLEAFAGQAVVAIQKAQLHQLALKKREYDKELHVARNIQQALLPRAMPAVKGLALAGLNISSHRVGGDFYDANKMSDGHLNIAIGDVSGKGIPGAIMMASLSAIYRGNIRRGQPMNKIAERVNKEFRRNLMSGNFATFFLADIDQKTLTMEYANAGHNPPLLVHKNGSCQALKATGTILGLQDETKYEREIVHLRSGDLLLLYTDGVTEAQDARGQLFGEKRLISVLRQHRHLKLKALKWKLFDAVKKFNTGAPLQDDVTMLVLKVS
jgi:sigma-B regulation protein RsbU (phosphoserine phosphatase)